METNLLEIAYKYLEKRKKASFSDIWKHVKKELNISPEHEEKVIGNLYTGMILDTHFFLKSDKLWYPRSQVSLDEIKSQVTSIAQDHDEEFDLSEDITDLSESFVEEETEDDEEDDDTIYIAEDSYDDGDQELDLDLNKKALQEEFQG
ncbi:DNA-directed RNA polymerase subunit delta [Spiroplasma platyhelix]|uniref:RNAP delta factor n=1 Tax=Spiroplasma platyhelix PALS-1 TaxID=1276218 RepID=A0A846TWR4_9MOLU|nr:DNA-directed RNA polymerase subunit delta [Spiroplasma platyhelix]MBE4704259.1 DNA-directed RNA polymerase subunit delta [Spiroplasma platyhelix PALS-1]NKE38632.1 DNA-directed RNA polymerase subunit delta [Spiroplasma platyhelix PALS-1]UJB28843.1 DNA directed RNA polymerase subunit delta [Spiroplasma platyhelix PALS-1]